MSDALRLFAAMAALLCTSVVFAECPPPKTEVTIANKKGKVHVICVAPAAIPFIGGEGDVVIPATCPCFTPEQIEAQVSLFADYACTLFPALPGSTGPCGIIDCYSEESVGVDAESFAVSPGPGLSCEFDPLQLLAIAPPMPWGNACRFGDGWVYTTPAQAEACTAILAPYASPPTSR